MSATGQLAREVIAVSAPDHVIHVPIGEVLLQELMFVPLQGPAEGLHRTFDHVSHFVWYKAVTVTTALLLCNLPRQKSCLHIEKECDEDQSCTASLSKSFTLCRKDGVQRQTTDPRT